MVYIREAHPADSPRARPGWSKVNDPETAEERMSVARRCEEELDLGIPFLVDDMEDSTARAYAAHPDRLYVIAADGKIVYRGEPGPAGFRVQEATAALEELLDAR